MQSSAKARLYALAAVVLWSTVASAFKLALRDLDVLQLLCVSSGTAALVLLGVTLASRRRRALLATNRRGCSHTLALGLDLFTV